MTASQQIDEALGPIKAAIIQHPFIVELSDGSLPLDAFTRYLAQNYLYLNSYAKALALVSARSLDSESVEFFARRAAYAIASEREFAADLAATIGIETAVLRAARPSPTGVGYASFVKQAAALEPLPVALATLLPWLHGLQLCFPQPGRPWFTRRAVPAVDRDVRRGGLRRGGEGSGSGV